MKRNFNNVFKKTLYNEINKSILVFFCYIFQTLREQKHTNCIVLILISERTAWSQGRIQLGFPAKNSNYNFAPHFI